MKTHRLILVGIAFLLAGNSFAQWTNVAPNLLGAFPSNCCGFGAFAYRDGITWCGRASLYMSKDSGLTWTLSSNSLGTITQIDFFNKDTGVLITYEGNVYLTIDQGKSWMQIHSGGEGVGVAFCGSPDIIYAASDYSGLYYSTDQGKSWVSAGTGGHVLCCLGKKDGSALVHNDAYIRRTTNGVSYQQLGIVDYDSWSLALDSSGFENTIYLMNEEFHVPTDNNASIFKSTDGGSTWTILQKHPGTYFSGSIACSKKAVFVQTLNNGCLESTDEGASWSSICGPSNNVDTRTLCAISDSLILAADANGSIWRISTSSGPLPTFTFTISTNTTVTNDTLGTTVNVPIYLSASSAMPSFNMAVEYNPKQLQYLQTVTYSGKLADISGGSPGHVFVHFAAADLAARKDSLIGYSSFIQLPADSTCAQVKFDSAIVLISGGPCALAKTVTSPAAIASVSAPFDTSFRFRISTLPFIREDTVGAKIAVPIYLTANEAMPSFDMEVNYPNGELTYLNSQSLTGKLLDITGASRAGHAWIHFGAADLGLRKDSLIGYSFFQQLAADSSCATVTLDSAIVILPGNLCMSMRSIQASPVSCQITAPIRLNIIYSISTLSRIQEDTAGTAIHIPIYIKYSAPLSSLDLAVEYPGGQLRYTGSQSVTGKILDVAGSQSPGHARLHFDSLDLALGKDSLAGYSGFLQLTGDTICSQVLLDSAALTIKSDPCSPVKVTNALPVQVTISAPRRPDLGFSIYSVRLINDSMHITVYLPIYLKVSGPMPSLDMIVHYPTYDLIYQKSVSLSGNDVDVAGGQWSGRAALHFDSADLAARQDTLLGYVLFTWTPYEYDCSHITFDSLAVPMPGSPCAPAGLLADSSSGGYIGTYQRCGLSDVRTIPNNVLKLEARPNPFSGTTNLTLTLDVPGELSLGIYDILGREVTLIASGMMNSGIHTFTFDGSKLPRGSYIARLECGARVVSVRIESE